MTQDTLFAMTPTFDGAAFDPALDQDLLTGQIKRIYDAMQDGRWRTFRRIHAMTGDGEASISAQLRNLRKARFGGHTIEKRRVGGGWEYRLDITPSEE